ncbi:uncharacterized protein BX663DRAFT_491232 [Cokeromyces recurvatus]|uniref:uncharacterized protein n=1 Tax=Cokeromyces recurvatus TaxID=90255 RepID=UPI00221FA91B|nr:uncharacterized protein BX663DRAFT_491232 [Cokeromyces recurvatus]KAI7907541.1 hypothetical protein BX663DRAFT_491232 [Cokeromyces recurvatus]
MVFTCMLLTLALIRYRNLISYFLSNFSLETSRSVKQLTIGGSDFVSSFLLTAGGVQMIEPEAFPDLVFMVS